jgi:multiple sugar transport system substrate-binding protein
VTELRGVTWDHPRGVAGLRAAAEAFTAEHPEIPVTWEARSLQAFADEDVASLAERYDLIVLDHPAIGTAVAREALVPLDEHLDASFLEDQDANSVGRSAESYVWMGHRWALAVDAAAQVAAVRDDLLGVLETPSTWDDVLDVATRIRSRDAWVAMPAIPVDAICAWFAVCAALGEEPCRTDTVVDRAVGREAAGTLAAVLAVAHPESLSWNPPRTFARMSTSDEVAYVPLAFGYVTHATAHGERRALRFTGGPAGTDALPRGTLGGAGVAVSAHTSDIDAACAFAAAATSAEMQAGPYVAAGGQPGHRAAWIDPRVDAAHGGFFSGTLEALDAAYLRERHDGFVAFQTEAGEALHAWLSDAVSAGSRDGLDGLLEHIDERYRANLPTGAGRRT